MDHVTDSDRFAASIRRAFVLSSFILPLTLAIAAICTKAFGITGTVFLADQGVDIVIAVLAMLLTVGIVGRSKRAELREPVRYVANMGFASVLFAHSVIFDRPDMFAVSFLWVIVTIFLSIRRELDAYIPILALLVHQLIMASVIYGILSWIHG